MGKKYHKKLFCKVFCKRFTMKDLVADLSYGKQETLTKRFVSYKTKEKYSEDKVKRDLKNVIEDLIADNLQNILDMIQDLDPMIESFDLNAGMIIDEIFEINSTNKSLQITMEK